jgi:HK97 gp10 family phage protein
MARSSIRVTKNNIPNVIRYIRASEELLPKALADDVAEKARALVPVQFGFLKNSIGVSRTGAGEYQVHARSTEGGADRDYAHFVEYGTRKMAAQPFMTPAYYAMLRGTLQYEANKYGITIESIAEFGW